MNLTPIWGSLTVFVICPLLGGLPLIDWITYALTGRQLRQLGTGNISVSAAFYHGGKLAGICAVLSEAAKGIIAVLLARVFFSYGFSLGDFSHNCPSDRALLDGEKCGNN